MFDPALYIVAALTAQVRGMRNHAQRNLSESGPLFQEILAAMVADLVDKPFVRVTRFCNVRRVKNDFSVLLDRRFGFVHPL